MASAAPMTRGGRRTSERLGLQVLGAPGEPPQAERLQVSGSYATTAPDLGMRSRQ
ncbi:hypothetical protein [Ectopseudomonas oleovorans]|uniref:hypothetical protein n=1 Tax=Ectopseudomonas oleovorans TaxID=301 RepID=UPI003F1C2317